MKSEPSEQNGYIFVPEMSEFFEKKRENVALTWISVHCALLFRDEFQDLCTSTKYIYLAIMLTCGLRGTNELPFNIKYLARIAGVERRTMSRAIDELLCANMLTKRERKKEREKKKDTDRQKETSAGARVSVEFENSLKTEDENQSENQSGLLKTVSPQTSSDGNSKRSEFTIEECLRYVEACQAKGDAIQNPKALASHLFKTGEADVFITATLYPQKQEEIDREQFGAPVEFTDEPCRVCFGAKMADADGRGFRHCEHCRNERGKSTGLEPQIEASG